MSRILKGPVFCPFRKRLSFTFTSNCYTSKLFFKTCLLETFGKKLIFSYIEILKAGVLTSGRSMKQRKQSQHIEGFFFNNLYIAGFETGLEENHHIADWKRWKKTVSIVIRWPERAFMRTLDEMVWRFYVFYIFQWARAFIRSDCFPIPFLFSEAIFIRGGRSPDIGRVE